MRFFLSSFALVLAACAPDPVGAPAAERPSPGVDRSVGMEAPRSEPASPSLRVLAFDAFRLSAFRADAGRAQLVVQAEPGVAVAEWTAPTDGGAPDTFSGALVTMRPDGRVEGVLERTDLVGVARRGVDGDLWWFGGGGPRAAIGGHPLRSTPGFPSTMGFLAARLGQDGTPRWVVRSGEVPTWVEGLDGAVDPTTGAALAVGYFRSGPLRLGDTRAQSRWEKGFVAGLGADGSVRFVHVVSAAKSFATRACWADGFLVAGSVRGRGRLAARTLDAGARTEAAWIAALAPDGDVRWARTLPELGGRPVQVFALACDADVAVLTVGAGEESDDPARETTAAVVALEPATGDVRWVHPLGPSAHGLGAACLDEAAVRLVAVPRADDRPSPFATPTWIRLDRADGDVLARRVIGEVARWQAPIHLACDGRASLLATEQAPAFSEDGRYVRGAGYVASFRDPPPRHALPPAPRP